MKSTKQSVILGVLAIVSGAFLAGCSGTGQRSGETIYLNRSVAGASVAARSAASSDAKAKAKADRSRAAAEAREKAIAEAKAKRKARAEARTGNLEAKAGKMTAEASGSPAMVSSRPTTALAAGPAPRTGASLSKVSSSLRSQILALNPERISDADIQRVLSKAPAPQVINIHGGIYPVHLVMKDFSNFLAAMGYPKNQTRLPRGEYSYSCYRSSEQIAGAAAWYYEQTGMRVLMVGHSQGGMQLMKVLHDLSGTYGENGAVRPFDPVKNRFEDRTTIRDPRTGRTVSMTALKPVYYATAVASGGAARVMPNQWSVAALVRKVPDATKYFTGYSIPGDFLGGGVQGGPDGARAYRATGSAKVRNVELKWGSEHVTVPRTHHLAKNATSRAWISSWDPSKGDVLPPEYKGPTNNLLYAANVWYEIRKYWCLSLQEAVR